MSKILSKVQLTTVNRIFDKDKDGKLNLDELVGFVAQVKKVTPLQCNFVILVSCKFLVDLRCRLYQMEIVNVDEGNIVNEMSKVPLKSK
jgi:hypothetical protein